MAQNSKNPKKANKQTKKDKQPNHKKKNASKSHSSLCPYIIGILVLIGTIAGVISYDVHLNNGVFEKSTTGKFLKDTGALPYVEIAWYKSMSTSARGYQWLEVNVPVYYAATREFLSPYCTLLFQLSKVTLGAIRNLGESASEFASQKGPVVANFVDQYVPGLSKKVQDVSVSAWSQSVNVFNKSCEFFKEKVFVGSLSPESLNKMMNQTQIAAAQYYSWFHNKVDSYAKIK